MTDPPQPLGHIARRTPPWRQCDQTECGRPLNDVARTITREDAKALIRKHGQQRAAFLLCITCTGTSDRYPDWVVSPSSVVAREAGSRWHREPSQIDRELFAAAALIAAHPEEFYGYLRDLAGTASLSEHRAARAAKR